MKYVVYGRSDCPWCEKALNLLQGQTYTYVSLSEQPQHLSLFKFSGLRTVPQVFSPEGYLIGGYQELKKHLEKI